NAFTTPAPIPCEAPVTVAVFGNALMIWFPGKCLRPRKHSSVASAHPRQPLMVPHLAIDVLGECGHSNGVIGEEHGGPPPCSGRRRPPPPPDRCRSDARSGRARTNPTSRAWRASSRSGRGVPPSRGGALQGLRRSWLVLASTSTRGREAAPGSPGAA